jgi:hypothetical protein
MGYIEKRKELYMKFGFVIRANLSLWQSDVTDLELM